MNDSNRADGQLDPALSKRLRDLCQQGYLLFDRGDYNGAIRLFYSAWMQLPKPQTQWQEAGWVLTALGDAYFVKGDFKNGKHALVSALHCPMAEGNPFIHLRLGQCLYELDDIPSALGQFNRVRENSGETLFEQEDPKYAALRGDQSSKLFP